MRTSRRLLALAFLAALVGTAAAALPIPPPPDHRINDFAGVLPAAERERLEEKLRSWERESSNQIVVAIFRSLDGENLEDYSIRLAQAWRIGQKGLDNGVIFLVFVDDRKMRLRGRLRPRAQADRRPVEPDSPPGGRSALPRREDRRRYRGWPRCHRAGHRRNIQGASFGAGRSSARRRGWPPPHRPARHRGGRHLVHRHLRAA
jgi:hypothetical protein